MDAKHAINPANIVAPKYIVNKLNINSILFCGTNSPTVTSGAVCNRKRKKRQFKRKNVSKTLFGLV
tara:strand:- start:2045 stop:2242 length:198 start_codon:yes stop_codon:yes gene_type:complete